MTYANQLELSMLELINQERSSRSLSRLSLETHLNESAEAHSKWMLENNIFSHTGINNTTSRQRIEAAGFDLSGNWGTAENLSIQTARGVEGYADDVEDLHASLMNSPDHRANILKENLQYVGIGIEVGAFTYANGQTGHSVVVTQNFGRTEGTVDLDDLNGGQGARIVGTDSAENVDGSLVSEQISAEGGSDWITPGGGNDTIDGGAGNDMVSFVDLPDAPGRTNVQFRLTIDLGAGTAHNHDNSEQVTLNNVERITGTIFADYIRGDDGANHLRGAGDYDWFVATTGNDTLDGGTGQDMVSFVEWTNSARNVISDPFSTDGAPPTGAQATGVLVDLADPSNNTNLAAGLTMTSVERVTGSGRQDVFYGDGQQNDFRGLGDYDWFVGSAGGRERYFGGDGLDTVTYFMSGAAVTASLRNGARVDGQETGYGTQGDAARDLYFEIENLVGTQFDDRLTGNNGRNQLSGLDGDDFLFGYGGVDYLKGGAGDDTIDGGAGSDYALFSGNRADYTLTRTTATEVTVSGADGVDDLVNVEYFQFADETSNIWDLPIA